MVKGGFEKVAGCIYKCDYDAVFRDIANKQIDEAGAYRYLCLNDLWFMVMFVMKVEGANHPFVVRMCDEVGRTDGDRELDLWARGHFKAVDENEPVPTPLGWVRHGEIKVGDEVFGIEGKPVRVIAKTRTFTEADCYRVLFNNGYSVVVSGDHLWEIWKRSRRRIKGEKEKRHLRDRVILSTRDLCNMTHEPDDRLAVRKGNAVMYPNNPKITIHPYILGCWLGDGTSSSGAITCGDDELFKNIQSLGYRISDGIKNKEITKTVYGILPLLRNLNVFRNKHIPPAYMYSSVINRLELLQGLMDTDGTCDKRGTATFCNKSKRLADDVFELAASLGLNPRIRRHNGKCNGEDYPFYQVSFQGYKDDPPFKLKRKISRCLANRTFNFHYITSIEQCNSIPVSCIEINSNDGLYLIGKNFVPTHNSSIITTAWVIQQILKNREERIGIFSHTRPAAKSLLRRVKLIFEGSEMLKACFPDVLYGNPESESPKWSEDDGLIMRREGYYNEGSLEAWGLIEGMPTGKHFTLRVYDDVETRDLVHNPDTIERLKDSFSLSHNLSSMEGRHRVIGTPYSHAGLLQYIRGMKYPDGRLMYRHRVVPVTEDGTADGKPVYLSASSFEDMRARASNDVREEYNFACQQLLNPTPVGVQRFNPAFLKEIEPQFIPKDCYKFMVIDPAGDSKDGKGDAWAMLTVGVEPKADEIGASNIYIMDACISPMRDSEAIEQIVRMYMNGGMLMQVGIEKVGLSSVEVHVANALNAKGRSISVDAGSLRILRPAGRNKVQRIEQALAWPLNNGKVYISKAVSSVYRERIRTEMEQFPYWHDDGLDALSYLYDMIKDYRFGSNSAYSDYIRMASKKYEPVNAMAGY